MLSEQIHIEVRASEGRIPSEEDDKMVGSVSLPMQQCTATGTQQGMYTLNVPRGKGTQQQNDRPAQIELKFKFPAKGEDILMDQIDRWRNRAQELERGGERGFYSFPDSGEFELCLIRAVGVLC